MKLILSGLAVLTMTTATFAGGIDRSGLPLAILFDPATTAQLSYSSVMPSISGIYATGLGGGSTGNMAQDYTSLSFAFKGQINDKIAYVVDYYQPYGADAKYPSGAYTGLEAHWTSNELDALLKYQASERISVYGGLRSLTSSANIKIPSQAYSATASRDSRIGYILGAAYEIPKIALRVGVTYQSAITDQFNTVENGVIPVGGGVFVPFSLSSVTKITMPQSLALDFQTGIAADTLLFGGVTWAQWSKWHVDPVAYHTATGGEITGFSNDVVTYKLGVGRKINDRVSVFAQLEYEAPNGDVASILSPTDGMQSIGIGGSWSNDTLKITGGLQYVKLGSAVDKFGTRFSGNHALGVGVTAAVKF